MILTLVFVILYLAMGFGVLAAIGAATNYKQTTPEESAMILIASALWPLTIPVVIFALIGTAVGDFLKGR